MTTVQPPLSPAWQQALPHLLVLIGSILFLYCDKAIVMVAIREHSETYIHASIVPPIVLWLIWRQRSPVLTEQPRALLPLAIPVVFTTFFWLLGELTAGNALTQFALVATLALAIMALLSVQVGEHIAFPLAKLHTASSHLRGHDDDSAALIRHASHKSAAETLHAFAALTTGHINQLMAAIRQAR